MRLFLPHLCLFRTNLKKQVHLVFIPLVAFATSNNRTYNVSYIIYLLRGEAGDFLFSPLLLLLHGRCVANPPQHSPTEWEGTREVKKINNNKLRKKKLYS